MWNGALAHMEWRAGQEHSLNKPFRPLFTMGKEEQHQVLLQTRVT